MVPTIDEEGFIARELDLDECVEMLRHRVAVFGAESISIVTPDQELALTRLHVRVDRCAR